ncbi:hypothetical protein tf_53 [Pseudomonas phage tf]|uniref:Uncharacterized protein n=1 Tax=Pseudomonas phage tf TaxID=1114179 RepID=I2FLS2_9CAUD|nr:hypothetical protein tf_53 [Pseudomonas phage tf]CCE60806.1 hypothetical protein tf_53 [Pseudomonas phage tf]
MMDLFQNLWGLGGAATAAPTDMSQIKVQQQPMDLAGTIPAANEQLSFGKAQEAYQAGQDRNAMINQGLLAASMALGGQKQQQQQPLMQAPAYRGGRAPDPFSAQDISGMNMAGAASFNKIPGLLAR